MTFCPRWLAARISSICSKNPRSLADRWRLDAGDVVGVIDLMGGRPVHAAGGDRDQYQPIPIGVGDLVSLLSHYRELGIRRFYLADLDSIESRPRQIEQLRDAIGLLQHGESIWIDGGWREGDSTAFLNRLLEHKRVTWVVASETCSGSAELIRLARSIDPIQLAIGLDFRGGAFCGQNSPADWINTACSLGIDRGIILEYDNVGSANGGSGVPDLRALTAMRPHWTWLSGGGVRDPSDVRRLILAGCDGVLVATALLPAKVG